MKHVYTTWNGVDGVVVVLCMHTWYSALKGFVVDKQSHIALHFIFQCIISCVGLCVDAIKLIVMHTVTACDVHFREVDVITPIAEPMWDIERYCLTYKKNGTTYELYDEQQILYPAGSHVVCFIVYYFLLWGKEQTQ